MRSKINCSNFNTLTNFYYYATSHKPQATSHKLRALILLALSLLLCNYSCKKDDSPIDDETLETPGGFDYGISETEFFNTSAYTSIMSKLRFPITDVNDRTDSLANTLTPDALLQRLDLSGAYLNAEENTELLQIPVRVQGSYKRSILSLTRDEITTSYIMTYPDSTDNSLFYISTLDGVLLQKTEIGIDGIGVNEVYNTVQNTSTTSRSGTCYGTVVYTPCSTSDDPPHSYEDGTAADCSYWDNPSAGTPPSYALIEVQCAPQGGTAGAPSSSGSSTGTSGGSTGGGYNGGDGFSGAPPRKGGNSLVDADDCVSNLDCDTCNLGTIDINSDCAVDDIEVLVSQINNCFTNSGTNRTTSSSLSGTDLNTLYNNPDLAIEAYNALTITCNPDAQQFLLDVLDIYEFGDEVDFGEKVILDSSFVNNEKAYCTYKRLTENTNFKQLISNFTGEENPNLTFKVEPIATCNGSNNPSGCTKSIYNNSSFLTEITINESYINNSETPTLFILRTIIHEAIHANLYLALYNLNQGNLSTLPNINDFPSIYEQFRQYKDWQHEFMADQYTGLMAQILQQVHPLLNDQNYINSLNDFSMTLEEFYEAIAYLGLNDTVAQTNYLSNPTNYINYNISFTDAIANSTKTPNCD